MLYDAKENRHGLRHDPFKALVSPRPIGWIGSLSRDGVYNLAPYSFFNAISDRPHYVMFSSKDFKDSVRNIHETGEFTCSLSTWETRFEMNVTSAPMKPEVEEHDAAGLETAPSRFIEPPRVAAAPAALECRHWKTIEMPDVQADTGHGHYVVIGEVVGIYIDDAYINDGIVDTGAMRPMARLGYMNYAVVTPENMVTINRPEMDADGNIVNKRPEGWDGEYR